jgi:hypothetical protein
VIEVKKTNESFLLDIIQVIEGNKQTIIEEKQSAIDNVPKSLIYKGSIPSQKMSGYVGPQGLINIFFYNSGNLLTCVRGNGDSWEIAPNF